MTNHPNRSAAKRMKWKHEYGYLTAIWPDGREWTFSRPGRGYVYCDFGNPRRPGTLGTQICYGGGTRGNTIHNTTDGWVDDCKKWLADYRRSLES